jgi:hypothetical protein
MRYIAMLLLVCSAQTPIVHATPTTGYAARYRKGLMARVAQRRGMAQEKCMVAATHHPLGARLRVTGEVTGVSLSCRVVDIPHPRDRKTIERRGIIIEVSHENALAICGSTRQAPRDCPVRVVRE